MNLKYVRIMFDQLVSRTLQLKEEKYKRKIKYKNLEETIVEKID